MEDIIDVSDSQFNHRKNTHSPSAVHKLTGKQVFKLVTALESNNYRDYRNPIDFSAYYRKITAIDGSQRSIPIDNHKPISPALSGCVEIDGYNIEYLFKGFGEIWALIVDGNRFIMSVSDEKPYKFSLAEKTGNGKCSFGAYNGQRIHQRIIDLLSHKIKGELTTTNNLHPEDYYPESWRLNHDISEFYKPEEDWKIEILDKYYYVIVDKRDLYLRGQGLEKILKFDSIDLTAIPDSCKIDSEGYYRDVVTIKIRKGKRKMVIPEYSLWYDALQRILIRIPKS